MTDTLDPVHLSDDERAAVAAFWWQRVYFDGVPLRRWEIVPKLAATPGVCEDAALFHLVTAEVAEWGPVTFGASFAGKGGLDPDGRWITISGNHCHTTADGKLDAGGPPALRKAMGQETLGDKVRGALGRVRKVADRVDGKLTDLAERASTKAVEAGKAAGKKGWELAKKYGPVAGKKALAAGEKVTRHAVKITEHAGKKGLELVKKYGPGVLKKLKDVGGAAAGRIGSAVKGGLSRLWSALKNKAGVGSTKKTGRAPTGQPSPMTKIKADAKAAGKKKGGQQIKGETLVRDRYKRMARTLLDGRKMTTLPFRDGRKVIIRDHRDLRDFVADGGEIPKEIRNKKRKP